MSTFVSRMPEGTYIELVRSLFRTVLPTLIMTTSFTAVGGLVSLETHDRLLEVLTVLGLVAALNRLRVLLTLRRQSAADSLSLSDARRLERQFAVAYLSFAIVFGLVSLRAFLVAAPDAHILIVGLLFGYGAGVAAGVSLRPWISVSAVVIAVTPTTVVALFDSHNVYRLVGCLLALFLAGGIQSMRSRYRYAAASITTGLLFASLARIDPLTGLPNRLAFAEKYNEIMAVISNRDSVAVHCLDLDHFKPVNDRHGHPVGDLLLRAVAERLSRIVRDRDFAARVGGDEFVVIQTHIADRSEADLMGRRIVRALSEPYSVGELDISVGASIGYALSSSASYDLEQVVRSADTALLTAKVRRGMAVFGASDLRLGHAV